MSTIVSDWLKSALDEATEEVSRFPEWRRGLHKSKHPPNAGSLSSGEAELDICEPVTDSDAPEQR